MVKILSVLMLALFVFKAEAQDPFYEKIISKLIAANPAILTKDKLVAVNLWNAGDTKSREANKAFDKVAATYEFARLRGGVKGVIAVAVNLDDAESEAAITLRKDGASKLISLTKNDFKSLESGMTNVVFDSAGNRIYMNLAAESVFSSFNQLITR